MIGLFIELIEWTIKLAALAVFAMIVFFRFVVRAIAAAYVFTLRQVHTHRQTKDPNADFGTSQLIACGIVAGAIGILLVIGALVGPSDNQSPTHVSHGRQLHRSISHSAHRF